MSHAVRPARRDDVAILVDLMAAFYEEAGFPLPRDPAGRAFAAVLDDPRLARIWVAEADGAPVGYVVVTFAFSMEYGGLRGFVDDFFVRPAARGRGLGAAALAEVVRDCREQGIAALLVETGLEGHPARPLYHRAGFSATDRAFLSRPLAPPLHVD